MMETLDVTPNWTIELGSPRCDLGWKKCKQRSVAAFRVHDCAFYYACVPCRNEMLSRLTKSFERFEQLRCKNCGLDYVQRNYLTLFEL